MVTPLLKELNKTLRDKGYMATATINCTLNAIEVSSPYSESLFSILFKQGVKVSKKDNESILIRDTPQSVFNAIGSV
jgi:hypothetical protein